MAQHGCGSLQMNHGFPTCSGKLCCVEDVPWCSLPSADLVQELHQGGAGDTVQQADEARPVPHFGESGLEGGTLVSNRKGGGNGLREMGRTGAAAVGPKALLRTTGRRLRRGQKGTLGLGISRLVETCWVE